MTSLLVVTTVPVTVRAFLLPYAAHFRAKGWRVEAAAKDISADRVCVEAFDAVHDIPWTRRVGDPAALAFAPSRVRVLVQQGGFDLVHVHTPIASFLSRFGLRRLRRRQKVRLIYTAHGFHFHPAGRASANLAFLSAEILASRWTDFLVVMNDYDEMMARRHFKLPHSHIIRMPGIGIDRAAYAHDEVSIDAAAAIREELGLASSDVLIAAVGELIPRKRHEDLLEAMARGGMAGAHLAIAGDGPLRGHLIGRIRELGLSDRVHLLGFRKDIPALLAASVALAFPSQQEGLPRSVMEAMCMGRPVIGADTRGTADLLQRGGGLLYPVGEVERLANSMSALVNDPDLRQRLGEEAKREMEPYAIENLLKLHERLYALALDE